ncbi:MAG: sigma-70 family RNA polymerase sigma factor [Planctomycetes bacterium]|nr:sigma-70 family RNA polymerase sigma factor [Planctomycetota bacterium]
MTTTPESLFAEFRRHGNANALASAFDQTAPELLRVAAFLVPRDEVEDAVHATYVVAMSRQEHWDEQRPLLPWLLGVLANEARQLRRRRRLQARTVLPGAEVPGPMAAAQASEVQASFARALTELPHDDAELLRLHLCEELTCREIGERLRRPAGTVRTQVSRAMSDLRRRLPVGLGVGVGFGELDPAALATVKARVLASGATGAVAVGAGGSRRSAAFGLTAVALLFIAAAAWLAGWFETAAPQASSIVATAEAQPPSATDNPRPGPLAAPADRGLWVGPSPVPEPIAPPWQLRGRVHGEDGVGIAQAWVLLRHGEFEPIIASTRSGADGGYALDLSFWRDRPALDRQRGFFVKAHAPGHNSYPHFGEFPDTVRSDQPWTPQVDFELNRYATLSGRVVDPNGRPVPAVVIADKIDDDSQTLGLAHAEADGTFVVVVVAFEPVKRARLQVTHPGGGPLTLEADVHEGLDHDLGR